MKDIAQRAGVSESAVSFALNDRPGVSEITRDRVRRVAEQLGWRPSTAARQLSGEGAATVGLVVARPADTLGVDSFFLQLISGIQEVLAERHLGLLFQVVEDVADECGVYRRWWAEHRVDGVMVVDPRTDDPRPDLLEELGLPAVVIGGVPDAGHPGISTVWADDAGAMAAVVDELYARGHRRIVHIAGLPGLAHTERRIRTLRAEAERRGLTEVRSVPTDYSDAEGAAVTRRVLESGTPPTALVYDNDVMAVMRRRRRHGTRLLRAGRRLGRRLGGLAPVPHGQTLAVRPLPRHRPVRPHGRPGTHRTTGRRSGPDGAGTGAAADRTGEYGALRGLSG